MATEATPDQIRHLNVLRVEASDVHYRVHLSVPTKADAEAVAAAAPKGCKLRGTSLSFSAGDEWVTCGLVQTNGTLSANGVNGGRNEAGIRRLAKVLAWAEREGLEVIYPMIFTNSITEAQVRALIVEVAK